MRVAVVLSLLLFAVCLGIFPRGGWGRPIPQRQSSLKSGGTSSGGRSGFPPRKRSPYRQLSRKLAQAKSATAARTAASPPMPTFKLGEKGGEAAECVGFDSYDRLIEAGHDVGRAEELQPVPVSSPVKLSVLFHDTPEKVANALRLFTCAAQLDPTR